MIPLPDSQDESIGSTSSSLLRRVKEHDEDAWRRLVRLYGPLVDGWLRQAGIQAADAHDVFQEVFQSVATGIGRFRRERPGDSFRGWLRTITRNKLCDHFHRRTTEAVGAGGSEALQQLAELEQPAEYLPATDEEEGLQQLRLRVMELIRGEFEAKTWEMFWQVVIQGRATNEVGRDFGVTPSAVRLAKSRVLRRLREEMKGLEDFDFDGGM
jgi:RNA polymerase sigma-70 factor (ECF subfamily)